MSTTQYPTESGKRRHPHLRLAASSGEVILPKDMAPDQITAEPVRSSIVENLILGFALAGTALHATPESLDVQTELLEARQKPETWKPGLSKPSLLHRLKNRLARSLGPAPDHAGTTSAEATIVKQRSTDETKR